MQNDNMEQIEPDRGCSPEMAALSFGPGMFDSAECRRWLLTNLRGDIPVCPSCGKYLGTKEIQRLLDGKGITCRHCDVMSSPRTGTILEGSTLTDQQFYFILVMLYWDFPPAKIAAMADCSRSAVYGWRNRLMGGV